MQYPTSLIITEVLYFTVLYFYTLIKKNNKVLEFPYRYVKPLRFDLHLSVYFVIFCVFLIISKVFLNCKPAICVLHQIMCGLHQSLLID